MSGRYAFRTGLGSNVRNPGGYALPDEEVGLGELAAPPLPIDYVSAAFDKWHLTRALGDELHPIRAAGFGLYAGHLGNLGDDSPVLPDPHHYRWRQVTADSSGFSETIYEGPPFDPSTFATSIGRKALQRWINEQTRPFVAYWAPTAPHAPYQVPPHELLSADTIAGIPRGFAQPLPAPDGSVEDADPERMRQYFHAMGEATDTEIGRLLDGIGAKRDETIVIVYGDNGTPPEVLSAGFDPDHAKSTVYQQGIQVPMIVAGPIVDLPGRMCHELVHAVDVWAAVAEIVGTRASSLPAGVTFDGMSFLDTVADSERQGPRTRVLCERFRPPGFGSGGELQADLLQRCYLDGLYKYMFLRPADGAGTGPVTERFFNIEDDPLEQVDLKATGTWTLEEQERYEELRDEMEALVASGP
jgi:arylsulfatase A-like enzyme